MDRINLDEYDLLPFDLEKCKAGHLTVTRDGRVFKFGCCIADWRHLDNQLIGWVDGFVASWTCSGKPFAMETGPHPLDLMLAVEKPKRAHRTKSYKINVRPGLEIIVNVEVDE
jgi:hypothetical protein